MSSETQTHPDDKPINQETAIVCDRCGLSIRGADVEIDKPAFTCGCDVTVYPTAPEPDFPGSWFQVVL